MPHDSFAPGVFAAAPHAMGPQCARGHGAKRGSCRLLSTISLAAFIFFCAEEKVYEKMKRDPKEKISNGRLFRHSEKRTLATLHADIAADDDMGYTSMSTNTHHE